jgi:segregation and condensation protein A
LIAATLVDLKARRLLPGLDEVELDEELLRFEERDLLLARLLECKTFKDAALALERLAGAAGRSYPRTAGVDDRFRDLTPDLLEGVTADRLRSAFLRAAAPRPVARVDLDHVAPIRASVTDAVEELLHHLPRVGRIGFRRLTAGLTNRLEVVVRFLAILELFKDGLVELEQPETFGSIEIRWVGGDRLAETDQFAGGHLAGVDVYEG